MNEFKVLGTLADMTACGYYRVILPYAELNAQENGITARTTAEVARDLDHPTWEGVDLLVMQRVVAKELLWLVVAGPWEGKPFMVEVDDLLDHLDPTNKMAWDYYQQEDRIPVFHETLRRAEALTVTTQDLADEYGEFCDRVFILPNCLPNWAERVRDLREQDYEGPCRIVYTGGPSHMVDVRHHTYGIGKTIKKAGDRATLTTYGHPWLRELGLTDEQHVQFRPWTHDFVPYQMSLAQYDVGLAPLKPTRFNRSKSNIKVTEYRAAGVVPIASDIECYRDDIEHGVDGFLCRTDKDWSEALRACIDDPAMVERMRQAGYGRVAGSLIRNNIHLWEAAYRAVMQERA